VAERAFATLLMCLRGSACIYQGEELGLPEADVPFDELQDPYGIEFWPEFKGRDGCRTPMVWEVSNQSGGFSSAARTWLPVPAEHLSHSVSAAENDPLALLHVYRQAIALRHAHAALRTGSQSAMTVQGDVLAFRRTSENETIFCAFNLGDGTGEIVLPPGQWATIGSTLNSANRGADDRAILGPWQTCLALKTG